MKYKTYYKGSKVVWYNTDVLYTLNMTSAQDINIADYIRSMPEPTVSVDEDDFVTMTFEPIPENIASLIIEDDKLRFQVVRHKANSSHSKNIYFPYSFQFEKYINLNEEQNLRWGISIPNNGWQGAVFNVVTRPTISELTSGKIVRDMSGLLIICVYVSVKQITLDHGQRNTILALFIGKVLVLHLIHLKWDITAELKNKKNKP